MKAYLLILFCYLGLTTSFAQPNYDPPSGVWCSCPPSTGNGTGSVLPEVAEKDWVQGILVRAVWKHIEPEDDNYNWNIIDEQITAAQSYGKKVSLGIGGGPNSPDWLYTSAVSSISYSFPFDGTIPVPWDTVFLKKWTEFIADFGDRYQNDTTIQLVYITNASANGFEMQIPFQPTPSYEELDYAEQKMIDSWKQVITAFDAAFPNHYLTNDYHPVNSSDVVADSIYAFAQTEVGDRYGASAWWWTQHNTSVYPAQYEILQHSADNRAFTGLQMAASGAANPSTFGTGGMPAALELAISDNVCYWEVWNNDILDGAFDAILASASCEIVSSTNELVESHLQSVNIFPNPTTGRLQVVPHDAYEELTIILHDFSGKTLLKKVNQRVLNLSDLMPGIYWMTVEIDGQVLHKKVIKQ